MDTVARWFNPVLYFKHRIDELIVYVSFALFVLCECVCVCLTVFFVFVQIAVVIGAV